MQFSKKQRDCGRNGKHLIGQGRVLNLGWRLADWRRSMQGKECGDCAWTLHWPQRKYVTLLQLSGAKPFASEKFPSQNGLDDSPERYFLIEQLALGQTANQKPRTKSVTTSLAEFQSKMAVLFLPRERFPSSNRDRFNPFKPEFLLHLGIGSYIGG